LEECRELDEGLQLELTLLQALEKPSAEYYRRPGNTGPQSERTSANGADAPDSGEATLSPRDQLLKLRQHFRK
jgi:hypothetical protein